MPDCQCVDCQASAGAYNVVLPVAHPQIVRGTNAHVSSERPRSYVSFAICAVCADKLYGAGPRKVLAALGLICQERK
jgi:hypothetical protein